MLGRGHSQGHPPNPSSQLGYSISLSWFCFWNILILFSTEVK